MKLILIAAACATASPRQLLEVAIETADSHARRLLDSAIDYVMEPVGEVNLEDLLEDGAMTVMLKTIPPEEPAASSSAGPILIGVGIVAVILGVVQCRRMQNRQALPAVSTPMAVAATPFARGPGAMSFDVEKGKSASQAVHWLDPSTTMGSVLTMTYFAVWYFFNVAYNIYNKKTLNSVPLPWSIALFQLFAGIPYVMLLWGAGLRDTPKLSMGQVMELKQVAAGHLGTHIGAVISLGAGAVSFTHIVKASEPVVSAVLMAVMMNKVFAWQVYASLIPIVGGVGIASASELSFTWLGFGAAMLSNVSSALRAIWAKKVMGSTKDLSETNLYAVLTIMSFVMLAPVSLLIENPFKVASVWSTALETNTASYLMWNSALSGITYYLYNETAFMALGRVMPVTHAIGNTLKRVVIIVSAVVFFHTEVSLTGWIGCSIAIFGTFLYSVLGSIYK
jgi:solute carrier family 35 protein E1